MQVMLCFEAGARTVQLNGALVRGLLPDEAALAALIRRVSTSPEPADPPRGLYGYVCPLAV
jgi:hypothetical protein